MKSHRIVNALVLLVLFVSSACIPSMVNAANMTKTSPDSVLEWNKIAQRVTVTNAKLNPSHATVLMAYVNAAIYDAVVAIEGKYVPYAVKLERQPGASVEAAVATAAHDVLVHYFPGQQADLDADLKTSLDAITDGSAESGGVFVGKQAAAGLIKLRQGDGFQADVGFVVPPAGPGVWQPLAGKPPLNPWLGKMKPFLLNSPDQFGPDGPPALTSEDWTKAYNEVKEIGRIDSSTRTAEQTDVAWFFTGHGVPLYDSAYRSIIASRKLSAVETARLYAMGYLIGADANIGCYNAKYKYLFWRPILAIRQGDIDGNPGTTADPNWTPLVDTPPFPEYTSAHSCGTAATAEVFAAALGTRDINVDVTSNAPNAIKKTRHFNTVDELNEAVIDARVWSGIHYRFSDVQGATLGSKVARWALKHYFMPSK